MATKKTDHFDVVLEKVGNQQLKTTKALCSALGLGLAAAKGMVDKAPTTVAKGLDSDKAIALRKELEALGNTVSIPGMETKAAAPATKKTATMKTTTTKTTTTKKSTTKKSTPSPSKSVTPSNDDFDAIFGGSAPKTTTTTKAKDTPKAKIERIEYASGSVYEGEMKDGLRHGVGTYRWSNGDVYIGKYVNDVRQGKGKFIYASGAVYEGDFLDGNFHGHGVYRWADGDTYDGEWKNDERHGNGKWINADGSYFTGVWENGERVSASALIYPSVPGVRDIAETEDCIEEVYEQDVDVQDDEFDTMTDYYKACIDEESCLFADGFGDLDNAVKNIAPFFQAVLFNLEDRDPGTAQEFLAEIVQVDVSALNDATTNDGIFSGEEVGLYDLCDCALKCAYHECLANPNELTETAMLHVAYYLYKEYSNLNDHSPSDLFKYYLDYYLKTYDLEQNIMWDMGALYFARLYVNDQQYTPIAAWESYYDIEKIYGEFFDSLLEQDDLEMFPNVQGRLYDSDFGYINAQFEEEEEKSEDSLPEIEDCYKIEKLLKHIFCIGEWEPQEKDYTFYKTGSFSMDSYMGWLAHADEFGVRKRLNGRYETRLISKGNYSLRKRALEPLQNFLYDAKYAHAKLKNCVSPSERDTFESALDSYSMMASIYLDQGQEEMAFLALAEAYNHGCDMRRLGKVCGDIAMPILLEDEEHWYFDDPYVEILKIAVICSPGDYLDFHNEIARDSYGNYNPDYLVELLLNKPAR